jgi:hypothetical protein
MTAAVADTRPIICDGCAREATGDHLRLRIARLEWVSRYRPIHVGTLFLMPAPPEKLEDYFYFPHRQAEHPGAQALEEDLLAACGIAHKNGANQDAELREFQQAGYFLGECVECPTGNLSDEEFNPLLTKLIPALTRRIRFSYRPKAVLPISNRLAVVVEALRQAKVEPRLLLRGEMPVQLPAASDEAGRERFRAEVGGLLREVK